MYAVQLLRHQNIAIDVHDAITWKLVHKRPMRDCRATPPAFPRPAPDRQRNDEQWDHKLSDAYLAASQASPELKVELTSLDSSLAASLSCVSASAVSREESKALINQYFRPLHLGCGIRTW